jgi:hypothetical protein
MHALLNGLSGQLLVAKHVFAALILDLLRIDCLLET